MKTIEQKITSAETSLNQIPALYKKAIKKELLNDRKLIVDFGAGKYNTGIDFMLDNGITVIPYDPYNRPEDENNYALTFITSKQCDAILSSNVMNVINDEIREVYIENIYNALAKGGKAFFTVYQKNKTGIGKETTKGYQANMATKDYLPMITKYFPKAYIKYGIIFAEK